MSDARDARLKLIKDKFKTLLPSELDQLVYVADRSGLDPLTGKIYPQVFNRRVKVKNSSGRDEWQTQRSMTLITTIDGYRAIAERTGEYRPGQRTVETSPDAIDARTNPHGIVSATAAVWKYTQGSWHEYSETVWWDEYAPLGEEWVEDEETGRRRKSGEASLKDGSWRKQGRNMMMKCAEAQALRRGWPDQMSGLYTDDMMAAEIASVTASEQIEKIEAEERVAKLAGKTMLFDFGDGLEGFRPEDVFGKVMDLMKTKPPAEVMLWRERNRVGLQHYWTAKPDEAFQLKQRFEEIEARQQKGPSNDARRGNPAT